MDYSEEKIRFQVIAGLRAEPWQVEMEEIDYGEKCGVFYRSPQGIKRAAVETRDKTENQIAFALLSILMNEPAPAPETVTWTENSDPTSWDAISPYEGKRGKHPNNCTCSKHKALDGSAQAA